MKLPGVYYAECILLRLLDTISNTKSSYLSWLIGKFIDLQRVNVMRFIKQTLVLLSA